MFSFATIYDKYYLKYVFYANKFLKDWHSAEDLVQECAIRVKDKEFDSMSYGDAYFMTCLKNRAIVKVKLQKTEVSPSTLCLKLKLGRFNDDMEAIDHFIEYDDIYAQAESDALKSKIIFNIYEQIESLPFKRREIFKLHYLEDKTNEEISKILGLSYQTVKNQLANALKELRITLNSKYRNKKSPIAM